MNSKKQKNKKWSKRFLKLAKLVATWSKDPSSQIGACVVDKKNRIVSVGFNGLPVGTNDDRVHIREVKYETIIHAEENALLFARRDLRGCTLYVTTLPCSRCSSKIIQSGIRKVVCPEPSADMLSRWESSFKLAKELFSEANVKLKVVK